MLEIHPATPNEMDQAALLLSSSEPWITLGRTIEQCSLICHDPEYTLYFALSGDMPAGVILTDPRGIAGSPYIKSIAVFPEFRGQGIGTRLLEFAEDLYHGRSKHLFICVSSFNTGARRLYERFGFIALCEFKDYIIEGASEILMHKNI